MPRAPFFSSRQVCGSPAACPPFHALTVEGGAPPPPRTWPPSLSPTWMYAIFARATHSGPGIAPPQPLCPRQQERGREQRGRGRKGSRVAPDVTGVADERRPPLRRPPRPCLSQRAGSRSPGRLAGWELGCPGPPPRPPLLSRAPPEALPRLEGGPGALGGSPGVAAGTAATPAQAGPETAGPCTPEAGEGMGMGKRVGGGGARVSPSRARGAWHLPRAELPGWP